MCVIIIDVLALAVALITDFFSYEASILKDHIKNCFSDHWKKTYQGEFYHDRAEGQMQWLDTG